MLSFDFIKVPLFYAKVDNKKFKTDKDNCVEIKFHPYMGFFTEELREEVKGLIKEAADILITKFELTHDTKTSLFHIKLDKKKFKIQKEGSCMAVVHPCIDLLSDTEKQTVHTNINKAIDIIRDNMDINKW